jgi:hypothetical protein
MGALLACLVLVVCDYDAITDKMIRYKVLADAFTVPGMIMVCVSALLWISKDGFFDGISYSLKRLAHSLVPFKRNQNDEKYYDYKIRMREKRISSGFGFIFFTGLGFLAIATVFIALFYSV